MVVMLDTPCSEVECKTTGYPLLSHVFPSLPLPCVTVCHHISTELYKRQQFCPSNLSKCFHFKGTSLVHNPFLSLTIVQMHAGPTASWVGAPHASVCIGADVPGNVSNIGGQRDRLTSQAIHRFPTGTRHLYPRRMFH